MSTYSSEEEALIRKMLEDGCNAGEIARDLGRGYDPVRNKVRRMKRAMKQASPPAPPDSSPDPRLTDDEIDKYINLAVEQQPILQKATGIERKPVIALNETGWFALVFGSDWHVGSIWSQYVLRHEAQIVHDTPGMYYLFGGDAMDGAIPGSPHNGIKNEQTTPVSMQREIVLRIARLLSPKLLLLITGCHGWWTVNIADYDFIAEAARISKAKYLGGGSKFYIKTTGGVTYVGVYHHKVTGHSQYNDLHPCVRRAIFHEQEADIIGVAHTHVTATGIQVIGEKVRYMMRTGGRKSFDKYGSAIGSDGKRDNLDVPVVLIHATDKGKWGQIVIGIEPAAQILTALRKAA